MLKAMAYFTLFLFFQLAKSPLLSIDLTKCGKFYTYKLQQGKNPNDTDHFARCKQHWSRSTSCFSFLTLHKGWDKIQPTEHIKLNQKVKQPSLRCFLYM